MFTCNVWHSRESGSTNLFSSHKARLQDYSEKCRVDRYDDMSNHTIYGSSRLHLELKKLACIMSGTDVGSKFICSDSSLFNRHQRCP